MLEQILIVDVETTGVDREKDNVIEYAYVLWNVPHRTIIECHSELVACRDGNPAQDVNGIPSGLLEPDHCREDLSRLLLADDRADAFLAHNAEFDREFLDTWLPEDAKRVWICSLEDLEWPKPAAGRSLSAIALAHGCAVVAAHRAINDCLLLARALEAVPDIDERLEAAAAHARLPKARMVSLASFEEKDVVKANGFHWDPARREWWRVMAEQDAAKLPFRTVARP